MTWDVKQSVNFYLEEFHPPRIPTDLRLIMMGVGLHISVATLVIFCLLINWLYQGQRLKSMTEEQTRLVQQVAEIEAGLSPLTLDDTLVDERTKLRNDLESSQLILRYLTQQELDSRRSFTTMTSQLGEQNINGMWLSSFTFYEGGRHVDITGYTDDPAKVSRYVTDLLGRSGFNEQTFRYVDVMREEGEAWLIFRLDSRSREQANEEVLQSSIPTSSDIVRRAREGQR